jgi:hypothetical protein
LSFNEQTNLSLKQQKRREIIIVIVIIIIIIIFIIIIGERGSVVGWGTMLQAGMSRVSVSGKSLDF